MASSPAAEHPALVVAARHGLVEERAAVVISAREAAGLLRIAQMDRLGGMLAAAIRSGHVSVDADTAAGVQQLWNDQLVAAVLVEALAVRTAELLDAAGVVWRLTKGPALAHLDYPDPAMRLFGDVDIIVHPGSWTTALSTLADVGWHRELAELEPSFDTRFGKGATISTPDGFEVDLHRRLAIGRFGVRLPTEELCGAHDEIVLAGRRLPTLDGAGRLIHACFHAALGGFRILRVHRDVAQLLLVSEVDWRRSVAVAERHRVAAVLARAIQDSWAALALETPHPAHDWATRHRIGRADARALAVFAAERPFGAQALTAVPSLLGRGSLAYLVALARQRGRRPQWSTRDAFVRGRRAVRRHLDRY
jgi:hypothetical protein